MNGIIVLNKEKGFTSFDCVNIIKHQLNEKKVGHTGTLDPNATGVLVVCVGEACKAVQFLEADKKTYLATILIGKSTDTFDATGEVTNGVSVPYIDADSIDEVLKSFIGVQYQKPPMYSAIKLNGKKLYQYARDNQIVEIEERKIEIFSLKRTSEIAYANEKIIFDFEVCVSKGTYIRSLCYDIAAKLGYPGLMKELIRTSSGSFNLSNAVTIEDIKKGNFKIYPLVDSFLYFPSITDDDSIYKAQHGMKISPVLVRNTIGNCPLRIVVKDDKNIYAVYELDDSNKYYKAVRVWNY